MSINVPKLIGVKTKSLKMTQICQKWHVMYQNWCFRVLHYRITIRLLFPYLFVPNKNSWQNI